MFHRNQMYCSFLVFVVSIFIMTDLLMANDLILFQDPLDNCLAPSIPTLLFSSFLSIFTKIQLMELIPVSFDEVGTCMLVQAVVCQ